MTKVDVLLWVLKAMLVLTVAASFVSFMVEW